MSEPRKVGPLPQGLQAIADVKCAEMESAGLDPEALSLMSRREECELRVELDGLRAEVGAWREYDDEIGGLPDTELCVKARRLRAQNEAGR
jgi:hypothetical protein